MLDALGVIYLDQVFLARSSIGPFDTFYILAIC